MAVIELTLPDHSYKIHIEPGALGRLGSLVGEVAPHDRAALLADAAVFETHAVTAKHSLTSRGYTLTCQPVSSGEAHKNLDSVRHLYDLLAGVHFERHSPLVAMGGGVAGDTAGFVAATYLRGVPLVQCPTTLLAMVDASVGGKVGVNLPQGKNLVGSFYQPRLVVADTDTLGTLPVRELRCGLAECVKHAVICDAGLFEWIGSNLDGIFALQPAVLAELVSRNVQIKAGVVAADEKEAGVRAHLNFGHTFAHAIEATAGYGGPDSIHHGEAVSLGMIAAARLAVASGRCDRGLPDQLAALLDRIGLPTRTDRLVATPLLMEAMRLDKKVVDAQLRLVLPDRLGAVSIVGDTPDHLIAQAWDSIRQ